MKPVSAFAIIGALLIAASSSAAEKKLVILFTGDNTGEIEPCG
jgi:hypothetical protein